MDTTTLKTRGERGASGQERRPAMLSKKQRALAMLEGIGDKDKGRGAMEAVRGGLAVCMREKDYEAAMRFAQFLDERNEIENVAGAWVRALLECGRKEDAKGVSARYKLGMMYPVIMRELEEKSKAKYGGWALVMQEAEDAFKWGDEAGAVKVMAQHSLTDADGKMLMLNLLREACAEVAADCGEELLGIPFNRYGQGYGDVTYLAHIQRLVLGICDERVGEAELLGDVQGLLGRMGGKVEEARAGEAERIRKDAEAATTEARERRLKEDWRLQLGAWLDERRAEVLGQGGA